MAVAREVDRLDERLAGVARIRAHVLEFLSRVDGELFLILFAASRANHATKLPFGGTDGAQQPAFAAVAFAAQHRRDRSCTAERADGLRGSGVNLSTRCQGFGEWLQQHSSIELLNRILGAAFPASGKGFFIEHAITGFGKLLRAGPAHQLEQGGEVTSKISNLCRP